MSGIGVLVQPLPGWREWLNGLSVSPEAVVLDVRGLAVHDLELTPPCEGLTLLIDQCQWVDWSERWTGQGHRLAVALREVDACPRHAIPCATSVHHVQQLAERSGALHELWLLPGDVAGQSGEAAAFVLVQAALKWFPQCRLVLVSSGGPAVVATLLRQGIDTVLLSDQLLLLPDYPLPAAHQRQLARLQRHLIRRYSIQTGDRCLQLQVAPLDPHDWRPTDPASLERYAEEKALGVVRHMDTRLAPMSEGVLLSRTWSEQGISSSELLGLYQRTASPKTVASAGSARGRAAMASWLGVPLPVVQGPMTRVSDGAAFARAVADAGAMPVIAAAMLPADRLGRILRETADLCGDHPWGVGLLAFRPQADLQPQIEQVLRARPDLIVLAGGNPSQISQFGDLAERVVIHSPTPELFERQLREGCRRFILEGRECGGHTGPCSSLSLWEGCLRVLASQPRLVREETTILFAGGIHSARSTSFIAALLEQFEMADLCHGLLVGTLTLFSQESVSTGAITPVFQDVLQNSVDTALLETAPGHQSRCALTPFAHEFLSQRRKGLEEGWDGATLAGHLDALILGRLRLATKGLRRDGDQLLAVSEDEQYRQGMFMVGEIAALQQSVAPLRQLLEQLVPHQSQDQAEPASAISRVVPEPIAITGMAVALPGATSLAAYWSLIVRQECQIRVVPEDRWPADTYYRQDGSATSVVSRWGSFIEPTVIDLAPYPLTPAQVPVTEPTQILALDLVSQALNAVGSTALTASERERTAVVFAASGGVGELGQAYTIQTALASDPDRFGSWLDRLPSWTNSSFPGLLSNVTAGRVSNAFDLSGSNLLVDAACASALAAVDVAVTKLRAGECDRVIVGSVDNLQGPFPYFCFSQSGALSRQGESRPFCTDSDGIVIGEGCAVVVLQRLETARSSGAEIHAVIDAIGSSSDGKGRSLTAPSHRGQMLAFDRAFAASDRHPGELRYYEAHGTGTPVGDRSEIAALTGFLQSCGVDQQRCAIGSVKALIGHTKASAGLAGLIKAVLALRHGTIPGQQPVREPHPELTGDGPVYVPATPTPWPAIAGERLAAVSAFGFGGTNFTVLLSDRHRRSMRGLAAELQMAPLPAALSVVAFPLSGRDPSASLGQTRLQIEHWLRQLAGVQRPINTKILESPVLPRYSPTWSATAYLALDRFADDGLVQFDALARRLGGESVPGLLHVSGVSSEPSNPPPLVVLFPGQGSVYPGMGAAWMLSSPRARQALDLLQTLHPNPDLLVRVLGGSRSSADRSAFWSPSVMQVVLMLHQLAALDCLDQLGLSPDAYLGHSIGDYLVLHAAGALPLDELVRLVVKRAICLERCIAGLAPEASGGMLVIREPLARSEQRLAAFSNLMLANRNAPNQGVVAGPVAQLAVLQDLLEKEGVEAVRLDLSVAYHHISLQPAADAFAEILEQVALHPPSGGRAVRLSTDPSRALTDPEEIRTGLRRHLCRQVDFQAAVEHTETSWPGAVYVDVGPRQTGSRLLQANHVAVGRTLRMDDREDSASQPIRVAFKLLALGFPVDESVLMHLASQPRRTAWTTERRGRLPYLVNGHAAIRLDGSPMPPSPLVPVLANDNDVKRADAMAEPGSDRLLEVYSEYQKTMRKFLESQDQVFAALAGGTSTDRPVPLQPSAAVNGTGSLSSASIDPPGSVKPAAPAPVAQPAPIAPSPAVATVTTPSVAASADLPKVDDAFANQQTMQAFITEVLVDRTGYPPELLELDAHLESDLGIDSIKQVEVLGALIDAMPTAPDPAQMQEIRTAAREKQTIHELSSFMLELLAGKN